MELRKSQQARCRESGEGALVTIEDHRRRVADLERWTAQSRSD